MQTDGALALIAEGAQLRVQLQLAEHGERAADVAVWLAARYPHINAEAWAQPGLCVTLDIARHHFDSLEGWTARFNEATGPLDIAFEILSDCFEDLALGAGEVLSVHVTGA